eukprot:s135_g25.t1
MDVNGSPCCVLLRHVVPTTNAATAAAFAQRQRQRAEAIAFHRTPSTEKRVAVDAAAAALRAGTAAWVAGRVLLRAVCPEAWYVAHFTLRDEEGHVLATTHLAPPRLLCASWTEPQHWAAQLAGIALLLRCDVAYLAAPLVAALTAGRGAPPAMRSRGVLVEVTCEGLAANPCRCGEPLPSFRCGSCGLRMCCWQCHRQHWQEQRHLCKELAAAALDTAEVDIADIPMVPLGHDCLYWMCRYFKLGPVIRPGLKPRDTQRLKTHNTNGLDVVRSLIVEQLARRTFEGHDCQRAQLLAELAALEA